MATIERYQKALIFEEASRLGIIHSELNSVPEIYRMLLGTQDPSRQKFGLPFTELYLARPGDLIDVTKLGTLVKNLYRDHQVFRLSETEVEDRLVFLNLDLWSKLQLLKGTSEKIAATAKTERLRVSYGASWGFVEGFNNTDFIDTELTTAWIDTSEGVAMLPSLGSNLTVLPSQLSVAEQQVPTGGDFLGSSASMALDGLVETSWRSLFLLPNTWAKTTVELDNQRLITGIMLDPVGFGIKVVVEFKDGNGVWQEAIRSIIYRKKTFSIDPVPCSAIRVSFSAVEESLPKVGGIRDLILYSSESAKSATIRTVRLKPTTPFTEVKIALDAQTPGDSKITPYVSTDGTTWVAAKVDDWVSIGDSSTSTVVLTSTDFSSSEATKGVFRVSVPKQTVQLDSGSLEVGKNQIEVSAFRRDWLSVGEVSRVPMLEDYAAERVLKTWTSPGIPPISSIPESPTSMLLQTYGGTVYGSPYYADRGSKIVFSRRTSTYKYCELCVAPLVGSPLHNTMQYNFNYKLSCKVFASEEVSYDAGRYWFIQGYRLPGAAPYSVTGKSYGSFALFINREPVASERVPATVYSNNSMEPGTDSGKPFLLKLSKGWNTIDLLLYIENPYATGTDNQDVGDPYLQLNLTPSLFDPQFQIDMGITSVLGSGVKNPSSEFDLIWNLPTSPEFWAWDENRAGILFNQRSVLPVDGYFSGNMPNSVLTYKGTNIGDAISDLYVRLDMDRNSLSNIIVDSLRVFTI